MAPRLIIMLKHPRPGAVKTRLIPALGERRACELYERLVQHTLAQAGCWSAQTGGAVEARVAGRPDHDPMRRWLGPQTIFRGQGEGDLGQRMERAVSEAFNEGASTAVVIGADCPEMTAARLEQAFRALESAEIVLGPAADGGYYLIGMRRLVPELFHGIQWGGDRVLEQTLAVGRAAAKGCRLLHTLGDVDRPEDLPLWARTPAAMALGADGISVIIPTLNEAPSLPRTLEAAQQGRPHEVIVVDGGSSDRTPEIARVLDAILLTAPCGRAAQMNHGAAVATGEYLLFLHADTLLPPDYSVQVRQVLSRPGVVGGAFTFAIGEAFPGRRLVEQTTHWRGRCGQLPYGDQGLFLRREVFAGLGGYRELPIMEDYDLVRRLRRCGRIAIAPSLAVSSGRRWRRLGWVRTTLVNKVMILGYHLGVPPSRLAAWYRAGAGPEEPTNRARHREGRFN